MTEISNDPETTLFLDGLQKIVVDLNKARTQDAEAVAMIGSLADRLIKDGGAEDWAGFKDSLDAETLQSLSAKLGREIEDSGNNGQIKLAYAMQAVAASLVGARFSDIRVAKGVELLDDFIFAARDYYVRNAPKPN